MDRPSFLSSIVSWLRTGYPQGVPRGDYLPLFALLRRQLSEDEMRQVAFDLMGDAQVEPINRVDVGVEVSKVTDELPRDEDIDRVRKTLETAGWPFENDPFTVEKSDPEDGS